MKKSKCASFSVSRALFQIKKSMRKEGSKCATFAQNPMWTHCRKTRLKQVKIGAYREECENVTRFAFSPMINSSFWIGPRHGAELVARFEFYS